MMKSIALDSFPTVKDKTRVTPIKDFAKTLKTGKAKTKTSTVRKKLFHADFEQAAKDYLKTPNCNPNSAYVSSNKAKAPMAVKNTANLATIMAVAAGPAKPKMTRPKISQPRTTKPKKTAVLKEKRVANRIKRIKNK